MPLTRSALSAILLATLASSAAGCVMIPNGPAVTVMPGYGKSLAEFQNDDATCRQFASQQTSGSSAQDAAQASAVTSAVVGTAIGAAAGAAFGGGRGAAIGAGSGLLVGSAAGVGASQEAAYTVQERYDTAYTQCMATRGDQVPYSQTFAAAAAPYVGPPPPPGYGTYGPSAPEAPTRRLPSAPPPSSVPRPPAY